MVLSANKRAGTPSRIVLTDITRTLIVWIIPLLFATPMLSRDVYSYLMQGQLLADGFDPYSQGAVADITSITYEVSPDWRNTTTPYGPAHLGLMALMSWLSFGSITIGALLTKIVSVVGFSAIAFTSIRIAQRLGGDPILAAYLGPANPLLILHLIGGIHNEAIMVGLVGLGVLAALERKFTAGLVILGVAIAFKATAILAVPFVVWMLARAIPQRLRVARTLGGYVRSIVSFVIAGFYAMGIIGIVVAVFSFVSTAGWGWISQLTGNSKVINPLSLPTLVASVASWFGQMVSPAITFNAILGPVRMVCMLLLLAGLVASWWFFRRSALANVRGITAAYVVFTTLNSVVLPWYYASVLALIGAVKPNALTVRLTIFFSLVIAVAFTGSGNHQLYNPVWMTVAATISWMFTQLLIDAGIHEPHPTASRSPDTLPVIG